MLKYWLKRWHDYCFICGIVMCHYVSVSTFMFSIPTDQRFNLSAFSICQRFNSSTVSTCQHFNFSFSMLTGLNLSTVRILICSTIQSFNHSIVQLFNCWTLQHLQFSGISNCQHYQLVNIQVFNCSTYRDVQKMNCWFILYRESWTGEKLEKGKVGKLKNELK